MAVNNKDRKALWGRSGSRCAMCRKALVADKTEEDPEAILGDEAHIAAQSPGGPRWGDLPPLVGVDSYDNLIMLCRVHHKLVEYQPNYYTAHRLLEIKADHEKWVNDRLDDVTTPGLDDAWTEPLRMAALSTGIAVWNLIDDSDAYLLTPPSDGETEPEAVDLADEFLQACHDYGEVCADVKDQGMGSVREARRTLQGYMTRLAEFRLLAFGTRQVRMSPVTTRRCSSALQSSRSCRPITRRSFRRLVLRAAPTTGAPQNIAADARGPVFTTSRLAAACV
jgi:hypothetical protein